MREVIGVIRMEQRPVGHRAGEICRKTTARGICPLDGENAAFVIEADIIGNLEIVPLAGGDHVVIPIRAEFDGTIQTLGR